MSSSIRTLRAHVRLSCKSWMRTNRSHFHLLTMVTTFKSGYKLTLTSKKPSPCTTVLVCRREVSFLIGIQVILYLRYHWQLQLSTFCIINIQVCYRILFACNFLILVFGFKFKVELKFLLEMQSLLNEICLLCSLQDFHVVSFFVTTASTACTLQADLDNYARFASS